MEISDLEFLKKSLISGNYLGSPEIPVIFYETLGEILWIILGNFEFRIFLRESGNFPIFNFEKVWKKIKTANIHRSKGVWDLADLEKC